MLCNAPCLSYPISYITVEKLTRPLRITNHSSSHLKHIFRHHMIGFNQMSQLLCIKASHPLIYARFDVLIFTRTKCSTARTNRIRPDDVSMETSNLTSNRMSRSSMMSSSPSAKGSFLSQRMNTADCQPSQNSHKSHKESGFG